MRIESLRYTERFGSVRINDLQKVLELDSGKKCETPRKEEIAVHKIEDEVIKDIEGRMAIVVPIKDEKLKLFEGVVSGIPHDCLIIVVSNSQRRRVDRFRMERDTLAQSPYAMVRVLWHYKPKISRGMYFRKWGRVSEITNKYMNALISEKTGFETEIIKTANAGEHAMTIKLAEILPYASGYAVEPQELISIFEGFGGILPTAHQAAAKQGIEIFQIETKNPHLHEDRGRMHLRQMLLPSLSVIYHSALCSPKLKQEVLKGLIDRGGLQPDEEVPGLRFALPPKKADVQSFAGFMKEHLRTYSVLKE